MLTRRVSTGMRWFSQQLQIRFLIQSIKKATKSTTCLLYIVSIIVIFYQIMRLYSLRESPTFHNLQKDGLSKDRQNKKEKIETIFRNDSVIQIVIDCNKKYFLRITNKQRIRQTLIMVDGFEIEKMLIFSDHFILLLSDKVIRYIKIQQLFDQYLYYDAKKIIFDEKNLQKAMEKRFLSSIQDICFNRMNNCMYILQIINKTITIAKFKSNIELENMENFEISQSKRFQRIRFIPFSYEEVSYDDAHFGIQIIFNQKQSCLYFLQLSQEYQIIFSKIYDQKESQLASKMRRINEDSYIIYYKNRLVFLKRENYTHKWSFQYEIYSQGQLVSQLKFAEMVITLQKINQLYCLFQYDLNKIITMQQISPFLIQIFHKPMNLLHIDNALGINLAFVGSRPYLIERCIFNLYYTLRDLRTDKLHYQYQDLYKQEKYEMIAFQRIKEHPIKLTKINFINQLSHYHLVQQKIKHLLGILRQLSCKQNRSILFYFSYEYFTIFLYMYHYITKQQALYPLEKPYIPSNINLLISYVIEKCSEFFYFFRKNEKFTKLRNVCKLVHSMAIFCKEQVRQANSIFENIQKLASNSASTVISLLYNPVICLQFAILQLRKSYINHDRNKYRKVKLFITKLLQFSDGYPPLVYLLVDKPQNYVLNAHHLLQIQVRRQKQAENDQSIIDFLKGQSTAVENYKRYNCLENIEEFSAPTNTRNLLCIRHFCSEPHPRKGKSLKQSNNILTKSCKTVGKLFESNLKFDGFPKQQIMEISQQQIIKMKIQMNQRIPLQLIAQQMSKYYHFSACLQLQSIKIKKSITIFIDQLLFVRRYNYNRKYDVKYIPNQEYHPKFQPKLVNLSNNYKIKDRMLIQFQNLLDPLIQGYIFSIAKLCDKFDISSLSSFSSKNLNARQMHKFGQFLQRNGYQRSEIKKKQVSIAETNTIITKIENEVLYIEVVQKNFMDTYLFIAQLQNRKFEISEHIRKNSLAQVIISISRLMASSEDKYVSKLQSQNLQSEQLINVKRMDRSVIQIQNGLKVVFNTSLSHLLIREIHKQLISLCLLLNLRWIGDPLDLFMQISSQPPQVIYSQGFLDNLCILLQKSIYTKI